MLNRRLASEVAKITTDSGANMKAACENYVWFACYCHKLNAAVSKSWADAMAESTELSHPGSKTRAWRGLIDKFERIEINFSNC